MWSHCTCSVTAVAVALKDAFLVSYAALWISSVDIVTENDFNSADLSFEVVATNKPVFLGIDIQPSPMQVSAGYTYQTIAPPYFSFTGLRGGLIINGDECLDLNSQTVVYNTK